MAQFTPSEILKRHAVLHGIHAGSANMKISLCLTVNRRTDLYSYWWKPNIRFTSSYSRWSLAMKTLCFHSSSLMSSHSTWRPTSSTWRRKCCSESRGWLLEDHTSDNRTLCHITQEGKPSVGWRKFLQSHHPKHLVVYMQSSLLENFLNTGSLLFITFAVFKNIKFTVTSYI